MYGNIMTTDLIGGSFHYVNSMLKLQNKNELKATSLGWLFFIWCEVVHLGVYVLGIIPSLITIRYPFSLCLFKKNAPLNSEASKSRMENIPITNVFFESLTTGFNSPRRANRKI